jgi:hypothetical protein
VGINELSLSGDDAGLFEISGTELYLVAGAVLDFENNPVLDITVEVNDPVVGTDPDDTASLSVNIIELSMVGMVGNDTVFSNVSAHANLRAMPYTMSEDGELESISIYHQGGMGNMILGVYVDNYGSPGSRLGQTASTPISSTEGWQTVSLQSPVSVSSGQTIWLAWVFQNNPGVRYTSGTPGRASANAGWSGGMPSSFGSSSQADYIYSVYATYLTGPDKTAPGKVTALTVTPGDSHLTLSWANPSDSDFAGVKIVRNTSGYPANPSDGTEIYNGTGINIVDSGLTNGTSYYYTAFTYDQVPNYSAGTTISGTPTVAPTMFLLGNDVVFSNVTTTSTRRAMPYTMSEDGKLVSISIYHQGGTGNMILGVYADSNSSPGSRLGQTASTPINSVEGWQTVSLQSPVSVSSGQTVWLAWVFENNPGIRYTSGIPGRASTGVGWSGGMPASFGSSSQADYIVSIRYIQYFDYILGLPEGGTFCRTY